MWVSRVLLIATISILLSPQQPDTQAADRMAVLAAIQQDKNSSYYKQSSIKLPPLSETIEKLSGIYQYDDMLSRALSDGATFYLFPDGTYLYVRYGDSMPDVIYDLGAWHYDNGFVQLVTDATLPSSARPKDTTYLLFIYKKRLHLIGVPDGLHYNARPRISTWKGNEAAETKKRLMKEAWRPEWWNNS